MCARLPVELLKQGLNYAAEVLAEVGLDAEPSLLVHVDIL